MVTYDMNSSIKQVMMSPLPGLVFEKEISDVGLCKQGFRFAAYPAYVIPPLIGAGISPTRGLEIGKRGSGIWDRYFLARGL